MATGQESRTVCGGLWATGFQSPPLGAIALTYMGARQIYREVVRRRNQAITDIFERAVAEAEASIASVTVAGTEPMSALPPGS